MAGRGAPLGNQNAANATAWRDALRYALANFQREPKDGVSGVSRGQALRKIAEQVVQQALSGNLAAIQEIGNRLDGKPAQPVLGQTDLPMRVVFNDVTATRPADYKRERSNPRGDTPDDTQQ
jgi:hypothetical protein